MKRRTFIAAAAATICAPSVEATASTDITQSVGEWLAERDAAPLFTGYTGPLFRGEIGRIEGFRFIERPVQARTGYVGMDVVRRIVARLKKQQAYPTPDGFLPVSSYTAYVPAADDWYEALRRPMVHP
jgi:hypothetical protein